ncbi:DUF1643 domain-containing protein [Sediminibacillus sp. JSM 1682029]|uniref:DUF1643 domain-containing protein n=1 Tax=Sediminibacillus sp. JSM 1682029 TaxID=3229857 RepID=UPI0035261B25
MTKKIYFSSYIDTEKIITEPAIIFNSSYRYSLEIPFKNRKEGPTAVVIMKNPSKAGLIDDDSQEILSDDTIYKVCDYLYKSKLKFKKVIVLNLFPIYGSTFKNIVFNNPNQLTGESLNSAYNNKVYESTINSLESKDDRIILAWGGYPDLKIKKKALPAEVKQSVILLYKHRIKDVLEIIGNNQTYKVGYELTDGKFPKHGKMWYDFQPLIPFFHPKI